MKLRHWLTFPILAILCLMPGMGWNISQAANPLAIGKPVLEWEEGGCVPWCQTGWYSSAAVADLDGDGTMEVIAGLYTLYILNGEDGSIQTSYAVSGDRVSPGVVVADIDNNGDLEIVFTRREGYLYVLDHSGNLVWSRQQPTTAELYSLAVYDLDGDGTLEIVVSGDSSPENTWVYEHDGTLRSGWPQLSTGIGHAAGVFNDNLAVGDIDGDGAGEVFVPSDVHYICAYEADGSQILVNAMYGDKTWCETGIHVDHWVDVRGYANCGTEHRPNFIISPGNIVDVNGDGVMELVAMGNVYNCSGSYSSLYFSPFIFNADRTRWSGNGFDWEVLPIPDGSAGPISENWRVIRFAYPNPVTADLDGDGYLEILYSSYDGRLHVYWLDKTEHHNWPYDVHTGGPLRFSSEPTVADLDNNGQAEVIFTTWVQDESGLTGDLFILDYQGTVLYQVPLPPDSGSSENWNGAMPAPTLANIDADANLEVVLTTAHSGIVAYEIPGTENARILWGTGRGSYSRTGTPLAPLPAQGSLDTSVVSVNPTRARPGDTLVYTIQLNNPGALLESARVTSTLSSDVTYQAGSLEATSGAAAQAGGVVTWYGAVPAESSVTITYDVVVNAVITGSGTMNTITIVNPVLIDDGLGNVHSYSAITIVNGLTFYLPLVLRGG